MAQRVQADWAGGIAAKAAQLQLSQQQLKIVELIMQHKTVAEVAEVLRTTEANIYNQLAKIRQKARALEDRKAFERLAEDAKRRFQSVRAQIVFLRQKNCSLKLISELLQVKYQKVADTVRRARGKYWVIEVPPPDPERVAAPAPENCVLFKTAASLYYHSFVAGDIDPQSREGRYRLLCAATGGVGGWRTKKILLTERARLTKEWAERSRATRETATKTLKDLREGRLPAPGRNLLRVSDDGGGRRCVPPAVRWVLENHFVRVSANTWRPSSTAAWRLLQQIGREARSSEDHSNQRETALACG